jgi:NAD+ dependent glucose-6-phosphate dehydrogenase
MIVKKVLVTGVYGLIGGEVYLRLHAQPDRYQVYGLARRRYPSDRSSQDRNLNIPDNRFFLSDMSDLETLVQAMQGIDMVVHMAADPRQDAPWESVLKSNIIGARNVYEAAVICGVKRVIYASSVMVSWGYFDDEPYKSIFEGRYNDLTPDSIPIVQHTWPTRPTAEYPASKVWGEGMGWYYANRRGLSVICLRIGWVNDEDYPHTYGWARAGWCSKRDVVQLVEKSLEAPDDLRFDIFYALSDNQWKWVDIDHARDVIGYNPQDNAEERIKEIGNR